MIKATTGTDVRAFEVVSAQIGFFNLVLDGKDTSAGVLVRKADNSASDGRLTTRGVTVQGFRCAATDSETCALALTQGAGTITKTAILSNICERASLYGCGLAIDRSSARMSEVSTRNAMACHISNLTLMHLVSMPSIA
jgi:hypothetical protein